MDQQITLQFELEPGADALQIATLLQAEIQKLENVKEADISLETLRLTPAEAVVCISGIVLVLKSVNEVLEQVKKLVSGIKEIRQAYREDGQQRIPLTKTSGTKTLE